MNTNKRQCIQRKKDKDDDRLLVAKSVNEKRMSKMIKY